MRHGRSPLRHETLRPCQVGGTKKLVCPRKAASARGELLHTSCNPNVTSMFRTQSLLLSVDISKKETPLVKRNIIVNLLGRGVGLSLNIVIVPIYLHVLGVAAVGLIGFYGTMYTLLGVVEHSVGSMLIIEMARYTHTPDGAQMQRDLMRTTELFYLLIALLIGLVITAAAPTIVGVWLSSATLGHSTLVRCVILMGWAISLQLGFSLNLNALNGLERQIQSSLLSVFFASARGGAALIVLFLISATSEGYFASQVIVAALCVPLSFLVVWRSIPEGGSATQINPRLLLNSLRYTPALTAAAVVFVILFQADKLIVSALLPLETFGHYVIASMLASLVFSIYGPIATALIPRFARLLAMHAEGEVRMLFHKASQFVALAMLPGATVVILYPNSVILLWTGDAISAANSAPILQLLTLGAVFSGLACASNSLQLAARLPQFGLYANLFSMAAVPLAYFATTRFGSPGATLIWLVMGFNQLIIPPMLLHRRLLKHDIARWYLVDLGVPVAVAAAMGVLSRGFVIMPQSRVGIGLWLFLVWAAVDLAVLSVCPALREMAIQLVRQLIARFPMTSQEKSNRTVPPPQSS